jgi:hypothetical protein
LSQPPLPGPSSSSSSTAEQLSSSTSTPDDRSTNIPTAPQRTQHSLSNSPAARGLPKPQELSNLAWGLAKLHYHPGVSAFASAFWNGLIW